MRFRLVKKIAQRISAFLSYESNYQPYSKVQQAKAVSRFEIPIEQKETILSVSVRKVKRNEYRKIKRMNPNYTEHIITRL